MVDTSNLTREKLTLSKYVTAVANMYPEGAIAFYASLPNDPWQKNNDELEMAVNDFAKTKNAELLDQSLRLCLAKTKSLIDSFKQISGSANTTPMERGWWQGLRES